MIRDIAQAEAAHLFLGAQVPQQIDQMRRELTDLINTRLVHPAYVRFMFLNLRRQNGLDAMDVIECTTEALARPGDETWVERDPTAGEPVVIVRQGLFDRLNRLEAKLTRELARELYVHDVMELYTGAWLSGEIPFGRCPADAAAHDILLEVAETAWSDDE